MLSTNNHVGRNQQPRRFVNHPPATVVVVDEKEVPFIRLAVLFS